MKVTFRFAPRVKAFTLVELLVSITIIAVLSVLGFRAIEAMMSKSRAAGCLQHIRQFGTAILSYAADNGGIPYLEEGKYSGFNYLDYLMPLDSNKNRTPKYLSKELNCPIPKLDGIPRPDRSYAGNAALNTYYPKLTGLPVPLSKVVLVAEMYTGTLFWSVNHLNTTIATSSGVPRSAPFSYTPQWHGSSEKRGIHIFCLDGHAELMVATDNDFSKVPTLGKGSGAAYNGGFFYSPPDFSNMRKGLIEVP